MAFKVLALGGDGIGPEVVEASLKVLEVAAQSIGLAVDLSQDLLHGACWEKYGTFIRPKTLEKARNADALLVGAAGGPRWDHIVIDGGPEEQDGLMKLRHELDVFACIRHARAWDALIERTPFKPARVRGADVVVMRELCGGAMFTQSRGVESKADGSRRAYDLNEYGSDEIARFARVGLEVARRRKGRVVSVDKSNVFIAGKLWREMVEDVAKSEFSDVELTHLFADNAAYQLCCQPATFDVILPGKGSVQGTAIYEPVHGSAPDIAGQGIANPVGMILSMAMMLEYSAGAKECAKKIELAVDAALNAGFATKDIGGTHGTVEMTDAIILHFQSL